MLEWEWYDDINTSRLFIHCILRANHTATKWRGHDINRGEFLTSLETLSKETGLTVSQVRTSLKKLESTNEIASLSQARSRMITVLKYNHYQDNDKQSDRLIAGSSQDDRRMIATDNNDNKKNNETMKTNSADVETIIDHLNLKAGTNFKASTKATQKILNARLKTYSVADCMSVIETKCAEWKTDSKMSVYLRPSTLFNETKFEGYLNQPVVSTEYSSITQQNINALSGLELD